VRPLDRVPQDGVQDLSICLVGSIKGSSLESLARLRVVLIDLAEGLVGPENVVGRECWRVTEGGDHWRQLRRRTDSWVGDRG